MKGTERARLWQELYGDRPVEYVGFLARSNQKEVWAKVLCSLVSRDWQEPPDTFNVLDVGSGRSDIVRHLTCQLAHQWTTRFHVAVVDSSAACLALADASFRTAPPGSFSYQRVRGWFPSETVRRSVGDMRVDLLLAIHIQFWIQDLRSTLVEMVRTVGKSGRVALTTLSSRTDRQAYEFRRDIFQAVHGRSAQLEDAPEVEAALRSLALEFETTRQMTEIVIRSTSEEALIRELDQTACFMARAPRETLAPRLRRELRERLRSWESAGVIRIPSSEELFWVSGR